MSPRVEEQELRRRAIEGVREEVVAFGSAAPDSKPIRREGLVASVAPAAPQRSLRATRVGTPLCARLGFRDLGFVEMWELRR